MLVVVSVLLTALVGQVPESSLGWVSYPLQMVDLGGASRARRSKWRANERGLNLTAGQEWVRRTWVRALARSELLAALSLVRVGMDAVSSRALDWAWLLPWAEWTLEGVSVVWPRLGRQPEMRVLRWAVAKLRWASLVMGSLQVMAHWWALNEELWSGPRVLSGVGFLGEQIVWQGESEREEPSIPWVAVQRVPDGWQVWFGNQFYLPVREGDVFVLRQTILLLRRLEGARPRCGGRATRDGRRPLIAQQALARVFEVTQHENSRWEHYEQEQDLANL